MSCFLSLRQLRSLHRHRWPIIFYPIKRRPPPLLLNIHPIKLPPHIYLDRVALFLLGPDEKQEKAIVIVVTEYVLFHCMQQRESVVFDVHEVSELTVEAVDTEVVRWAIKTVELRE